MFKRIRHALIPLLLFVYALPVTAGLQDELARIGGSDASTERDFLPADEAFKLIELAQPDGTLAIEIVIASGYYVYRDRIAARPLSAGLTLAPLDLPPGEPKLDPEFGDVMIYRNTASFVVAATARPAGAAPQEFELRYQGCAEDAICYPPIKKTLLLSPPATPDATAKLEPASAATSPTDRIAADLGQRSFSATVLTFLGLGLLLAFTPCVLPMIPILSGIIVGQGPGLSTSRAFGLSVTYVVAMALAYAAAGVAAGLLGRNLQAAFQHPAVIVGFSFIFVLLAFSMFGLFELALPSALQSRFDRLSRAQRGGTYGGVAVMGVLSAIIVGPCVAPPLAGALAFIGQTGSALTGGSALFALGLGMGLPLIALGTSTGALLPRAGSWMNGVRNVFGVMLLGVAIWFLERIINESLVLVLWALLLIGSAVFMGALDRLEPSARAWPRLKQGLALVFLLYGALLIVGAAAGAGDPMRPLVPLVGSAQSHDALSFQAVTSLADIDAEVARAASAGRAVMVDVYADWCIECKHLEQQTFPAAQIAPRLARIKLLRADVTADNAANRELLAHFELFGPPAVLFFVGGQEQRDNRLVGFAEPNAFALHLDRVEAALK